MGEKTDGREGIVIGIRDRKTGEMTELRCWGDIEVVSVAPGNAEKLEAEVDWTEEQLKAVYGSEMLNAKKIEKDEFGIWYEVAKKAKEEALCRDGDGNYHLITTERTGGSKEGLQVVQKRSRELMPKDDAQHWALENLRMEEYEKAFPNE